MKSPALVPCALCGIVPGRPDVRDGLWRVVCPLCGRESAGPSEADARAQWAQDNAKAPAPLSPALELLDSIEAAMCDLEAIRTVPGAMTVWHRWMDDLRELRELIGEAENAGHHRRGQRPAHRRLQRNPPERRRRAEAGRILPLVGPVR